MTINPTFCRLPAGRIQDSLRAISGPLCDLGRVKTLRACRLACLLAPMLIGGSFPLHAQTNDTAAHHSSNVVTASTSEPEHKPAPTSGKLDYSSFQIISDRNIFNGSRSGQRLTSTRSSTQQRSVRVESFSLVGTLLSEEKAPVAFFDGTSSELRKPLKAGGNIAGFTVKEILHAGVRMSQGTNTFDLPVGSGMRREDEGLWKFSTTGGNYASAASIRSSVSSTSEEDHSSNSNGRYSSRENGSRDRSDRSYSRRGSNGETPATSSGSPSSTPTDAAEILKRLMEKREKE